MDALRYALFGQPVAHSRSPRIHGEFAAQAGIEIVYQRIETPPESFVDALADFARAGGRGANVTLPHKAAARLVCETLSERAARAGAVNTLMRVDAGADAAEPARWHGDNTDGIGLVRDLRDRHGVPLADARVLLLGAGGAGAGVAPALLDAGIATLVVINRNESRARALVAHLADARACALAPAAELGAHEGGGSSPPDGAGFDIVINATSAARTGAAPWDAIAPWMHAQSVAVDLGYGEAARPFLDFARARGVGRRIDGLGMLVEQAAESFRLWHGISPDTGPVHTTLRGELGNP